jgi:hypothetical protein
MKSGLLIILSCLFLGVGCNGNKRPLSFQFEREIELKADSIHIAEIFSLKEWKIAGDMLLIRSGQNHPVFYTYSLPDLKFAESFGFIGRGPDEYLYPHIARGNRDEIYIYDNGNRKIQTLQISKDGYVTENEGQLSGNELFNQFGHIDGELFYGKVENPRYLNLNVYRINSDGMQTLSSFEVATSGDGRSGDYDFVVTNNERVLITADWHNKQVAFYHVDRNNEIQKLKTYAEGVLDTQMIHYTHIGSSGNFIYALYQGFSEEDVSAMTASSVEIFDTDGNGVVKVLLDRVITEIVADNTGRNFYAMSPFRGDYIYRYTLP